MISLLIVEELVKRGTEPREHPGPVCWEKKGGADAARLAHWAHWAIRRADR